MSSEWYKIENSIDIPREEKELIEESIPHLSTIMSSIFGNLEEFDQYGGTVSIINNFNQPIGINITYALFGEQQLQYLSGSTEFEQYNKISIFNREINKQEFVAILLNRDNSVQEIQTNISLHTPYSTYKWLLSAYKKINHILDYPENYYLDRDDYRYHGPDEISDMNELKKQRNL